MSASEHVNETLFHGTRERLKPGDIILPPSKRGVEPRWDEPTKKMRENAFATPSLPDAIHFAKSSARFRNPNPARTARVYEVEPVDPETVKTGKSTYSSPYWSSDTEYSFREAYSPEGFRVIRRRWVGKAYKNPFDRI